MTVVIETIDLHDVSLSLLHKDDRFHFMCHVGKNLIFDHSYGDEETARACMHRFYEKVFGEEVYF